MTNAQRLLALRLLLQEYDRKAITEAELIYGLRHELTGIWKQGD